MNSDYKEKLMLVQEKKLQRKTVLAIVIVNLLIPWYGMILGVSKSSAGFFNWHWFTSVFARSVDKTTQEAITTRVFLSNLSLFRSFEVPVNTLYAHWGLGLFVVTGIIAFFCIVYAGVSVFTKASEKTPVLMFKVAAISYTVGWLFFFLTPPPGTDFLPVIFPIGIVSTLISWRILAQSLQD